MGKDMDRLIEFDQVIKESLIYKITNLLWTDQQKTALIENAFVFLMRSISKIRYLRNEILDGDQLYLIKTKDYTFLVIKEGETHKFVFPKTLKIMGKKQGFWSLWEEIEFPLHIIKIIEKASNAKELKLALQKAMELRAFW